MKKKIIIGAAAVVVLTAAVVGGLGLARLHQRRVLASYPRVILVGMDGAGWNFIDPLLADGRLPHFRAMMHDGAYGTLQTVAPTKSSIIWTCIATGKTMAKHGIVDWTFVKKNNIQLPYSQSERRAKAFWNILSDRKRTVGVINWFVTYPPEPVNGFMVSEPFRNLGRVLASGREVTYPPELLNEIKFAEQTKPRQLLRQEHMPDFDRQNPHGAISIHFPLFVCQDKTVEVASLYLLQKKPVEVFAVYFHLIDAVSHFGTYFMDQSLLEKGRQEQFKLGKVTDETRREIDSAYSRQVLAPIYDYADRILGEFLVRAKTDTTVIVCSDHGFYFQGGGYNHYNTWEIPHGIVLLKGPRIRKDVHLQRAHIYDILPTMLYLVGLPVGRDMDGQVLGEAFDQDYFRKHPVKFIPTYEDGRPRAAAGKRNKDIDEKTMEEFKALGYIK
jgi:predicted AlkP superfamily phosphohydrolase/phosphomutase